MKYRIEEFPNPELIEIHLTKKVTNKRYNRLFNKLSELSSELKDLVQTLLEVPGVIDVSLDQYSIRVEKAKCFDWKQMEPALIETIDVMLATNETDTLEALPAIRLAPEERDKQLREVEEYSRRNRGGFWIF
jgi:hypothetical protein